jgi:hypothetical protein
MFYFMDYLMTPYVQGVIFFLLIGLFVMQRRRFESVRSGFSWLRFIFLLILFLYFALNWASEIPPSLRTTSIMAMFFINLYMVYNLLLGNLSGKYRQALDAYGQDIANKELLDKVWSSGKKYIKSRYFFDAVFSGYSPGKFLKDMVSRQIPADIQSVFAKHGVDQDLISNKNLISFLMSKLNQSQEVPQELKDILAPVIKQFGEHAWIQEQVNEFLRLGLKDPEKLFGATWNVTPPKEK